MKESTAVRYCIMRNDVICVEVMNDEIMKFFSSCRQENFFTQLSVERFVNL